MRNIASRLTVLLAAAIALVATFAGVSFAAGAAEPADGSLLDYLQPIYDAFKSGNKPYAAALTVVLGLALLKRYGDKLGARFSAFIKGDVGGALLALAMSFAGAVAVALHSGAFAMSVLWAAGGVAVTAAGGYTLIKKLIMDPLFASAWYKTAPAWAKAAIGVVGWIFGEATSTAIPDAEAAGKAAVTASPAQGEAAAIGTPTELK